MKRILPLFLALFFFFIASTNAQTGPKVTIASSKTVINENENVDITATLEAATDKDVVINLLSTGTATNDLDYTTAFIGKGIATTVAGGNGLGAAANQLANPSDIFVNQAGTVYVLDSNNSRIQKWEKGATAGTTVVALPSWGIRYFFIDAENNIYISDQNNSRIQKWSASSPSWITVAGGNGAGNNANQLSLSPAGIFVDSEGSLFIADQNNNRIQKWLKNATSGTTVAGGNGSGSAANQLSNPSSIFVDSAKNIYVGDIGNNRVQKWEQGAITGFTVVSGSSGTMDNIYINRIFGDTDGTIYIMYNWNAGGIKIKKWSPGTNAVLDVYQSQFGSNANQVSSPSGIFVDNNSNIFIADRSNNRIQKIQIAAQINIKAGQTTAKLTISAIDDSSFESDETVIIAIDNALNADASTAIAQTVTIKDNDVAPAITFSLSSSTIVENAATPLIITATPSVVSGKAISIPFTLSGTATLGTEFTISSNVFTIAAGASSGTVSISTLGLDDTSIEPLESIILTLGTITNATSTTQTVTTYVESDDNPTVSIVSNKTQIAEQESLEITATIPTVASRDVFVNLALTGTATGDLDYTTTYIGKGTATTVAGGNGSGAAANQLSNPSDIFVDQAGTVYVLDAQNNRIQKWEKGATTGTTVVALPSWGIRYFFIDAENNIYISDQNNSRIQKWSASSPSWITVAGGSISGTNASQLSFPQGIFVDAEGSIFIADSNNNRIQKWPKNATSGTTVAGGNGSGSAANQLSNPSSIFVDSAKNIYVGDNGNNRVQKWNQAAIAGITIVSSSGGTMDNIYINRISGNTDGTIYIQYGWNAMGVKIKRWSTGASTLVDVYQSESGSGANQIMSASGFFADNNSNIFIADSGNNRIQKIQMAPQITIPAGQTTAKLTIKGVDDGSDESDETIIITPATAINGVLNNTNPVTVTLTDINDPPVVTFAFSAAKIVENSPTDVILTATVPVASGKEVEIFFTTEGTAKEFTEYTVSSKTIKIAAGSKTGSLTISTKGLDDAIVEILETIIFKVNSITNATTLATTATLFLESDDNPSFTITSAKTSIAEHESVDITATLQAATSKDVTVSLDLSGTAKADVDYTTAFFGKGTATTVAGGNGMGAAANQLANPSDIFVDQAGTVYVLDTQNNRIQKWEKGATTGTTVVALPSWGIRYFFIDAENNIYISDQNNSRIQKWSASSPSWITVAGGSISGTNASQLSFPQGIFVDAEGSIFIADSNNNRIQKWPKNATSGTTVAGGNGSGSAANQLSNPSSIFVDSAKNIYVGDNGNNRVQKWNQAAIAGITVVFASANPMEMTSIRRVFGNTDGTIYIQYGWNAMGVKIKRWSTGASTLVDVYQSESGSGANQIMSASGFFADNNSNIFIADSGNNRIQKIQIAPQITIKSGETIGKLTIKGIEDDLDGEGIETVIIKSTSAQNAVFTASELTVSILDNTKSFTIQSSPFPGLANGSVAWGDYDRDGDLDVAIMGQSLTSGAVTSLYENKSGVFVNTNQNFVKLYDGDISWIDVNKDGWIDLVVSGYNDKPYTKLYINKQGVNFEPTNDYGLPQLYATTMAWGDLDNDGDIDLAIAGLDATDKPVFSIYYREDGSNKFVQETSLIAGMYVMPIPGFIKGDMKIIDIDLDGDNDLVYNGENANNSPVGGVVMNTLINPIAPTPWYQWNNIQLKNSTIEVAKFKNHTGITILSGGVDASGNNMFFSSNSLSGTAGAGESINPKLKNGDIAVADYNIDGLNDIVFTGENQTGVPVTKLYIQDTNGRFQESPLILQGLRNSTASWVDYDMDGDLDLFLTGEDNTGAKTILYKSEIANKKNTSPAKITGLKSEDKGYGTVRFSWDKPVDDFSTDLSYVLRLGTTPGGTELSNTESDLATGRRLIAKAGQVYTNFFETQLDPGVYYWSIQAVDTGVRGGVFSDETSITVTYDWKMLNQGGIVDRRISGQPNPALKLADLNNDNRLDLIYGSSSGMSGMTQTYRFDGKRLINLNNSTFNIFGATSGIETGDVNGDGTADVLMIAGTSTPYKLSIYLSNGQGGYAQRDLGAGLFKAKAKIVDLNNDGTAEIVLMGLSSSQSSGRLKFFIYEYVKATTPPSFTTTEITNISSLSEASFDLGDVDKDGDVDFILSGFSPTNGLQSFIYTNDTPLGGVYTFTQTSNNLVGVRNGTTSLIDFDGDGDLDAVFTGTSVSGDIFEIYINKINEGIMAWPRLNNLGLIPMREGKIDIGDFNGDGYADLLYSGILDSGIGQATRLSEFDPITKRYNSSTFDVSDIIKADVEFGDLDGDGDLDFSLSGESKANPGTHIFRTYINFRNESAKVLAQSSTGKLSGKGSKTNSATFVVNKPPTVPVINTVKNIDGGIQNAKGLPVEFSWAAATDDHTPVNGLTYALKIGTTPGGDQIMSANANTSGIRKSSEKGNMEHNVKWKLRLPVGVYYWSVQAIDASYTGSAFSATNSFEVTAVGLSTRSFEKEILVNAHPNPTSDIISVTIPEELILEKIEVYNSVGQFIAKYTTNTISLQNQPVGAYFLKIYTSGGTATKKIIKL